MKININIYRAGLLISFVAINILIVVAISNILSYLNTGAERSSMLHTSIDKQLAYQPEVEWQPLVNEGRSMESQTLQQIEKDYLNAWYIRNVAYLSNKKYGIKDFYTDSARVNLYKQIDYQVKNNLHIEGTTIAHHPELLFYSADGQMVVIKDKGVQRYERVLDRKKVLLENSEKDDFKAILLLEDGFWRIRHLVKEKNSYSENTLQEKDRIVVKNGAFLINEQPFHLKGINYYPAKTPWDLFGKRFDSTILKKDFKLIKSIGLNSIRIFIPYENFGKENVHPRKLEKLKIVLDLAQENDIKVVLTLFDFYGDYSVLNWTLTHRHAQQIVETLKNHPALLAWDIKNEPDLDFESRGKRMVLAWLKNMIKLIKSYDNSHPVTIGWASPEAAIELKDHVDFVSWHFYQDMGKLENAYSKLKVATSGKLLVLQEFGLSSYKGFWNPFGYTEEEQANYHQKMQQFIKKKKIPFMSWTLYDFETVPKNVVGRLPWRKQQQKHFGFITSDGIPKASFKYISHD
ncbi:glycoside hydrolase family 2 TIM barrel-domain containing protein [Ascidiimonas sp. W6]|uniref:glycoside hydrolase family 2 TIM barrel-domain containing protein n=1 Tax=Ascidiimonas meishanensis TaxID=3128903 RepID=UPI0030EBAA44